MVPPQLSDHDGTPVQHLSPAVPYRKPRGRTKGSGGVSDGCATGSVSNLLHA